METITVKENGWFWKFKEGEIRYVGIHKYSDSFKGKRVGKTTCYGPAGFKLPAHGNTKFQKQVYRNGEWRTEWKLTLMKRIIE